MNSPAANEVFPRADVYPHAQDALRSSQWAMPLRIGLVGTFPPRACGLATFTADVAESLRSMGDKVVVAALVDAAGDVAPGATYRLVQPRPASARSVADELSKDMDVVLVEHEFGIFGGERSVLGAFTDALTVPYVVTMHTVLGPFAEWQRDALAGSLAGAALVFAFSEQAVNLLVDQFPNIAPRCRVVPHGSPTEMYRSKDADLRRLAGLAKGAKVMTTFGLLSPSKGIELVIRAMRRVREASPEAVYVVAGRTHPEVVRRDGERYRDQLLDLCRSEGVEDCVVFRNWFHDVDELSALLRSSDVFVTPYADAAQIVSGALSFAVAAGLPFVSTPYRYAVELAASGCGETTGFGDHEAMASALSRMLLDETQRHRMASRSDALAAARSWPQIGERISGLLGEVVDQKSRPWPLTPLTARS